MLRTSITLLALLVLTTVSLATGASAQLPSPNLSISGTVWQDDNANGKRDEGETGIAGAALRLISRGTAPGTDAVVLNVATDEQGRYSFNGLDPYRYEVSFASIELGIWHQTQPPLGLLGLPTPVGIQLPASAVVTLTDKSVSDIDLGLFPIGGIPQYRGTAWKDAQPAFASKVTAMINGVDCTLPPAFFVTIPALTSYRIRVAPDALIRGCGVEGARISFFIDGRRTNETEEWHRVQVEHTPPGMTPRGIPPPGSFLAGEITPPSPVPQFAGQKELMLTVGPVFASYYGNVFELRDGVSAIVPPGLPYPPTPRLVDNAPVILETDREVRVKALIDGKVCGSGGNLNTWQSYLVVHSEAQTPGCGRPGAVVHFTVDGWPATETAVWQPGLHGNLRLTYRPGMTTAPPEPPPGRPIPPPPGAVAIPPPGSTTSPVGITIRPPDTGDAGLLP